MATGKDDFNPDDWPLVWDAESKTYRAPNITDFVAFYFFSVTRFLSWAGLVALAFGLGIGAFYLKPESYLQDLSLEFSTGIATFLITAFLIPLAHSPDFRAIRYGLVAYSVESAIFGFYSEGILRSLYVQWTVMFAVVLALEFIFHDWLKKINKIFGLPPDEEFGYDGRGERKPVKANE